jgi:hypothetical protein
MLILSMMMACNRDSRDFWVKSSDVDAVVDLGVLDPIPGDVVGDHPDGSLAGVDGVHYEQLGAPPDPSQRGGATLEFVGTGGKMCVLADPETVFWNQDISKTASNYVYQDDLQDDGDLDMSGGLSAYYTGSPGVAVGDFRLPYTDPLGQDHEIDFNECNKTANPAGRGTLEYCEIDTSNRKGISFTMLLKTFSLPIDDGVLSYGVAVLDSACSPDGTPFRKTECTIPYEADDGSADGSHAGLEDAFCSGKIDDYCAQHLDDKDPPCTVGYVPSK